MRVILDTNVLLSGLLISRGAPAKVLGAWERQLFTLVACDALIEEFREVASRPFFRARLRASAVELLARGCGTSRCFAKTFRPARSRRILRMATCWRWRRRAQPISS